jgi:tRNA A37 threonylcarbamoyladenosine biosynthesis protein TsaE
MADELKEVLHDKKAVVLVEWGNVVDEVLPAERIRVKLTATGDDTRNISISIPDKFHYMNQQQ